MLLYLRLITLIYEAALHFVTNFIVSYIIYAYNFNTWDSLSE